MFKKYFILSLCAFIAGNGVISSSYAISKHASAKVISQKNKLANKKAKRTLKKGYKFGGSGGFSNCHLHGGCSNGTSSTNNSFTGSSGVGVTSTTSAPDISPQPAIHYVPPVVTCNERNISRFSYSRLNCNAMGYDRVLEEAQLACQTNNCSRFVITSFSEQRAYGFYRYGCTVNGFCTSRF